MSRHILMTVQSKNAILKQQHMSKLKAKDPVTAEPSKPKLLISGAPGVGKTWFSLEFPNVYFIDTEGGANLKHYTERLKRSGGVYMGQQDGSLDPGTLVEQFTALATENHNFKTVVVDSISKLFNTVVAKEQERLGDKDAFGASKKPAIAFMRRLVTWADRLDMNVLFIAHETAEWGVDATGQRVQIGYKADTWEKLAYELHLWMHVIKRGPARTAVVRKSRLLGFPDGDQFPLEYPAFAERYGKDIIDASSKPITLAKASQVSEINTLLEMVKVDDEWAGKCFTRAGVEGWSEMSADQLSACINALKKRIK